MKISTLFCCALITSVLCISSTSPASAQATNSNSQPPRQRSAAFTRFDTNKNGKIDEAERPAFQAWRKEHRYEMWQKRWEHLPAQRKQEMLKEFDANKNGKIEMEEYHVMEAKMAVKRAEARREFMERFDKNKNGRIDIDERPAVEAWQEGQWQKRWESMPADQKQKMLERLDTNKDGKIDKTERAQRRQHRKEVKHDAKPNNAPQNKKP